MPGVQSGDPPNIAFPATGDGDAIFHADADGDADAIAVPDPCTPNGDTVPCTNAASSGAGA